MIVFLDRHHHGKPHSWDDMGASRDLDGNGLTSIRENESILTGFYILHAEIRLRELGHSVCVLSDGRYSDRHARVNQYAGNDSVYVACHVNAGATASGYGSVFFDFRTSSGNVLAADICTELARLPELDQKVKTIEAGAADWTRNAYNTIKNVNCHAVCFEPFFIDSDRHRALTSDSGLKSVGVALADGIHRYFQRR